MSEQIVPQDFYVYVHRKATTGEIFYVGKGKKRRAWETDRGNPHWQRTVKKHGHVVEVVRDGLQEWAAFELECELIALYGRKDLGLGALVNKTNGGEGVSGTVYSEEFYKLRGEKISVGLNTPEAQAKLKARRGENNPFFGKQHSEESNQKNRLNHLGKKASDQTKIKQSETHLKNASLGLHPMHRPEVAAKVAEKLKGRTVSPETCLKLKIVNTGKKLSAEHKANIKRNAWRPTAKENPQSRPVISDCGLFFWSAREASRAGYGNVMQAARTGCKALGKKWRYATPEEFESHKKATAL